MIKLCLALLFTFSLTSHTSSLDDNAEICFAQIKSYSDVRANQFIAMKYEITDALQDSPPVYYNINFEGISYRTDQENEILSGLKKFKNDFPGFNKNVRFCLLSPEIYDSEIRSAEGWFIRH